MMENGNLHGGGMVVGWIIGLILIAIIFWLIYSALLQSNTLRKEKETALDILRSRYAKGEISKSELEEMSKNLNQ